MRMLALTVISSTQTLNMNIFDGHISDPFLGMLFRLESFASGHTSTAFAVGVFLALYLNAKLKAFADYSAVFWKFMVVLFPIIGAMMIGGNLTIDKVCPLIYRLNT